MFSFLLPDGFGSSDTTRLRPFVSPSPREFPVHRRRHLLLVVVVLHRRARRGRGRDRRRAPSWGRHSSTRSRTLSLSLAHECFASLFILAPKSAARNRSGPLLDADRGADASNTQTVGKGVLLRFTIKSME